MPRVGCSRAALLRIRDILSDETLNDTAYFYKIEAIISLLNDMGIFTGTRHDF